MRQSNTITGDEAAQITLQNAWERVRAGQLTTEWFVQLVEALDYVTIPGSLFVLAIQWALEIDAATLARDLAQRGSALHPDHSTLQQAVRVFAPGKATVIPTPPIGDQAASMRWLQDHSAAYQGQWVALRSGQLLGTAATRKELVEALGIDVAADVLITRIV